jgi:hypothetical protein
MRYQIKQAENCLGQSSSGTGRPVGKWPRFDGRRRRARHSNATMTMNIYTQEIPSSVEATVEALDQKLFGALNTIEHEFMM